MSSINTFTAAAQALAASLAASAVDPADAIRLMSSLSKYFPALTTPASPIGASMAIVQTTSGDMLRRAALVGMARASALYQPASVDDAAAIRTLVCSALDDEIRIAGDQHEDATYNALRNLRAAVSQDLTTRGAGLANITSIQTPQSLPALALAQRVYRDPRRADELVTQSNSVHPAFMPVKFKALSK